MRGFDIQIRLIRADEREKLIEFAKSFNHEIKSWAYPIFVCIKDGKWISYHQLVNAPVLFNAFHPDMVSSSDVAEIFKKWVGFAQIQWGSGFTAAPLGDTKFTKDVMERMGLQSMNMELYELKT